MRLKLAEVVHLLDTDADNRVEDDVQLRALVEEDLERCGSLLDHDVRLVAVGLVDVED